MRGRGAQVLSRPPARCAAGAGAHGTPAATTECTVASALPTDQPPPSAALSTCTSPSMDSSTSRARPGRHFSSVGNGCRCYLTSGTRETIHPSYQSTPRTRNTLPCALPGPDSLVTACGCAVRPGSADGGRWRRRTTVCRPSTRSSLAGSASPPGRAIPRSSRGMRAPRERRGSVADVGVARGGGFCMSAARVYGPDRL